MVCYVLREHVAGLPGLSGEVRESILEKVISKQRPRAISQVKEGKESPMWGERAAERQAPGGQEGSPPGNAV